jgi:hypothetical protein
MSSGEKQHGKKIDAIVIEGKVSKHTLDLRFQKSSGEFAVQLGDKWYVDRDMKTLMMRLTEAAHALDEITWSWWILPQVSAGTTRHSGHSGSQRSNSSVWSEVKEALMEGSVDVVISSLQFDFMVVAVSDQGDKGARLILDVTPNDEGELVVDLAGTPERCGDWAGGYPEAIPYTKERYATLLVMRESFRGLCERVLKMFDDDAEKVAKALDGAPQLLLGDKT